MRTLLTAALALAACHHDKSAATGGDSEPSADGRSLLAAVPDDAFVVVRIDPKIAMWNVVTHGFILPLPAEEQKALDKELRELFVARIGIDPSGLRAAVGFARGMPPTAAALFKSATGKLVNATDDQGVEIVTLQSSPHIVLAHKGDVVAVGEDSAVRAAFEVIAGKKPSFTKSKNDLAAFFEGDARGAAVALAAHVPDGMPLPPQLTGIKRATMSFANAGVKMTVEGDPAALGRLRDMLSQGIDLAIGKIEGEKQAALAAQADTGTSIGLVLGSHYIRGLKSLMPKLEGDKLVANVHFELADGAAMAVPMIGIMAAVAIPAFMTYVSGSRQRAGVVAPEQ